MALSDRAGLERQYREHYDVEAVDRATRPVEGRRAELRDEWAAYAADRIVGPMLDVGSGPGRDTRSLRDAGFDVVPIDVSSTAARLAGGIVGSIFALPIATSAVGAAWTMSTFVHVPDDLIHVALDELVRVVRPGGELVIGTWGGVDEVRVGPNGLSYYLRSDDRWLAQLDRIGRVTRFEAWDSHHRDNFTWSYRFGVIRIG